MHTRDSSVIEKNAQALDEETTRKIVEQFNRDGYCFLENVLTPEEVDALRDGMERKWNDPGFRRTKRAITSAESA